MASKVLAGGAGVVMGAGRKRGRARVARAGCAAAVTGAAVLLCTAAPSWAGEGSEESEGADRRGSEIVDLTKGGRDRKGPTDVLIGHGPNRISPEAFETYTPPRGYFKNTPRTAEFNTQETLSSPGSSDVTEVTTPDGYTWMIVARTRSAMWPFRRSQYTSVQPRPKTGWEAAFMTATPPRGTVRWSANSKNQIMYFWAREGDTDTGAQIKRYFIRDRWGNRFTMMSSGASTPEGKDASFEAAVLPRGWRKSTGFLKKTLVAKPAYDLNDNAQFNVFRDSADNSWVQIGWGRSGNGTAQRIGDTMPIWGGRSGDRLRGTNSDDVFHGAQGNDTFFPMRGNDVVFGDAGRRNVVVLPGASTRYRLRRSTANSLTLTGPAGRKRLDHIQRVRFSNGTCTASAIRAAGRRDSKQIGRCQARRATG